MANLPVNFESKVKAANGADGYPYRISARDLMANFVHASVQVPLYGPTGSPNGITEKTTTGEGGLQAREIFCTAVPEGDSTGDMLYWGGQEWIKIPAPSGSEKKTLTIENGSPEWGEGFPDGVNENDMLYWDGQGWVTLSAPSASGKKVLSVEGGNLIWGDGGGEPVEFLVWNGSTIGTITLQMTEGFTPLP